jgi:hypothetical protein
MWDDGLVEAWKRDERFTLMMAIDEYPPNLDRLRFWLGFHKDCRFLRYVAEFR